MIRHLAIIGGLITAVVIAGLACDDAPTRPIGNSEGTSVQFIGMQWPHQAGDRYHPIDLPITAAVFGRTTYGDGTRYEGFTVGILSRNAYSSSNLELPGKVAVRGKHIFIELEGLFEPIILTDAFGPAYSGYMFDADTGSYLLTITYGKHRADFRIILRERQLEFSGYSSWIQRDGTN